MGWMLCSKRIITKTIVLIDYGKKYAALHTPMYQKVRKVTHKDGTVIE